MFQVSKKRIDFYGDVRFEYLDSIGFGSHSDIYKLTAEGKIYAIKVFNDIYIHEEIEKLDEYKQKLDINIDSFIFPLKLLYINDKFSGYLMKLCKGKDLSRKNLDINVETFAKSSIKLFNDVQKLSKLKYVMDDNHISNIMYDNGFKWIDTCDFTNSTGKSFSEIETLNLKLTNEVLIDIFVNSTGIASVFLQNNDIKRIMNRCTSGKITFEELFNEICIMAYNVSGEEIAKVSDVGKVLKKHYNKI